MGRKPCCAKEGLNRGAWSAKEDQVLTNYINIHGEGKWRDLPQKAGLKRCGKSCRLRWLNYLRPDIKRGNISTEEEELIVRLHNLLGNRWSLIAGRLPGRTDNEVKNYWNTNLSKRVVQGQIMISTTSINITPPNTAQAYPHKLSRHEHEHEHKVIRTKAVKCTKAVIVNVNQTASSDHQDNNINNHIIVGPKSYHDQTDQTESSDFSAVQNDEDDNYSADFLMDLDINDELLASDVPIPDFNQFRQLDENGDNHGCFSFSMDEEIDHHHFFQTIESSDHDDLRSLAYNYLNLEDHDQWNN